MSCKLTRIFTAQRELLERFHQIEEENGFRIQSGIPVNLDDKHDQLRLKEFAWRVTEEVGEVVLAMDGGIANAVLEEVSDTLHFFVELMIISGMTPSMICLQEDRLDRVYELVGVQFETDLQQMDPRDFWLDFVIGLTKSMNLLKNRPWKQKHTSTNIHQYRTELRHTFYRFVAACISLQIPPQTLEDEYFRKHSVNQERQRSGV